jgi:hypothetical protein
VVLDVDRTLSAAGLIYVRRSIESRVLPSVRKFKELGATTENEIDVLQKTGREPRALRLASIEIKTAED